VGVIIGMDAHKRSATIEAIGERAQVLAAPVWHRQGRLCADAQGGPEVRRPGLGGRELQRGRQAPRAPAGGQRRHGARRARQVSAQVRAFATGNGRRTDPADAHSVALAALRSPKLARVEVSPDLVVPGLLAGRREELGRARTQTINRIRRLLLELIRSGGRQFLSAAQARALLSTTRPRDLAGKTRRRLADELITELEGIDRKIKASKRQRSRSSSKPEDPRCSCTASALQRSPATGPRGQHAPVRQPGPLRVLERHRAPGRVLRTAATTPALLRQQPADQPDPAHHGHRPAAQPSRRPRLLRRPQSRRETSMEPRRASNDACPTWPGGTCSTTRTTRW
jgi:hypothetical protein